MFDVVPQVLLAKKFAEMVHANHSYGEHGYGYHLDMVEQVYADAGMTSEDDQIIARLHDTIEDIAGELKQFAYDFVKLNFSDHVFQTVWAMTGIGINRVIRTVDYYHKIGLYQVAADYKIGDRIANIESSKKNNRRLYEMYVREHENFNQNVVALATNSALIERYTKLL